MVFVSARRVLLACAGTLVLACGSSDGDPNPDADGSPTDSPDAGTGGAPGGTGGETGSGGTPGCDNGATNPPDCDACAGGVEFFANSCADVIVPEWIPPSGEWCARAGYGFGSVADALPDLGPYDDWLLPTNPDAGGHRKLYARLFSQVTVQNSVKWGPWAIWGGQAAAHTLLDQLRPL
ncbi:MAG TPA: hypothetical protein VLC09_18145, partial [Polyangiaceae bacterium]|nr:hypothetical protein [Polyangiaceae bacterium]